MRKGAHTQYDIQVHIVWITKYRKKILVGKIATRLKVLLLQGCSAQNIAIIKGKIMPDHVHLLISIPASLSAAKTMQYLKGRTSKKLQEEFVELKKQFWGQHLWATGYFCRSVGTVTQEIVKEYIENQDQTIDDLFNGNIL